MIATARFPKWVAPEGVSPRPIRCEVQSPDFGEEWLPFLAHPEDPEAYGRKLYADLVAGKFGPVGDYVAPVPSASDNNNQNNQED